MEVAYNNVFRRFFGDEKFSSVSQMFVENKIENFAARMRRLIYGFRERYYMPQKIAICLMNNSSSSNCELCQKWENVYMCNHV